MPMGFSVDPGPLPFWTVRDRDKWAPRLANGQIEIVGEGGFKMPLQMVRVAEIRPIQWFEAADSHLHVPNVYQGRPLIAVRLEAL